MKVCEKLVKKINEKCPYNQGIFMQPYGIPTHIKELVVYSRYETGGMGGGNCWGEAARHYEEAAPKDHMTVLDILLEEIAPNISYLQFRKIAKITHDNNETQHEYYGNSTDWFIEYVILSELLALLETL